MIAKTTTMIKGIEICTDALTDEQIARIQDWDVEILSGMAVRKLVVNRKTYKLAPGFFSIVNAKVDAAGSARRNYEARRSSLLTREALDYIRENLGVDYEGARLALRKIRAAR